MTYYYNCTQTAIQNAWHSAPNAPSAVRSTYGLIRSAISSIWTPITAQVPILSRMGQTAAKIATLTKDVALDAAPYLVAQSLWFFSRNANMRVLNIQLLSLCICNKLINIRQIDLINSITGIAEIFVLSDLLGLVPEKISYRVACDSFLLFAMILGNNHSIYAGTQRLITAYRSNDDTNNKLKNLFSGAIITSLGVMNLQNNFITTDRWVSGLQLVQTLSTDQQWGVCRYRAIQELPTKKTCNAVFFDGSPKFMGETLHPSMPFGEILFQNCNTQIYRVNNTADFCKALAASKSFFQDRISIVALTGHANSYLLALNPDYDFRATNLVYSSTYNTPETECLKDSLPPGGQALLIGCNTASPNFAGNSLTKRLAKALPGRTVIGFADFFNPFTSSTHYSNGLFEIMSHYNPFLPESSRSFHFFSSSGNSFMPTKTAQNL